MNNVERNEALEFHRNARGKLQVLPTVNIRNEYQLALAYVPGSTPVSEEIMRDPSTAYDFTGKANMLAEISNGSATLGMGNTGPLAVLPVLEGKCLLLKLLGDVNAIPMGIDAKTPEEIVAFAKMIAPTYGGINIEDISSPDTFYVIRELSNQLDIPVFCDDQQGTAVIVLSAVKNALKLLNITLEEARIVMQGAGASGIASAELLLTAGAKDIVMLNARGILGPENTAMDPLQENLCQRTNPRAVRGGLNEAATGADIFIGLSRGNTVTQEHIKRMNRKPVVLALALPDPEITAEEAHAAGAFIYASGRMKDSNTLLNMHAFPGMVRGTLDVRAKRLTDNMMLAASEALSNMVDRRHLSPDHISPRFFGSETTPRIAEAVGQAAINDGVALYPIPEGEIYSKTWYRLFGDIEHI